MDAPDVPRSSTIGGRLNLWELVRENRRLIRETLVVFTFLEALAFAPPLIVQAVIDKAVLNDGLSTLTALGIGLVLVAVFQALLTFSTTYASAVVAYRMDRQLSTRFVERLLNLPLSFHGSQQKGDLAARLTDIEQMRQFVISAGLTLIIDGLFTLMYFLVMLAYSPRLTFLVALSLLCYLAIAGVVAPRLKHLTRTRAAIGAQNQALMIEAVAGVETIKAFGAERVVARRWSGQFSQYVAASMNVVRLGSAHNQLIVLVNRLTAAGVVWIGAFAVVADEMTTGQLVAFTMLAAQMSGPLLRLAPLWQDYQQFRVSLERLGLVFDTEPEAHGRLPARGREPPTLAFRQLTFAFPNREPCLRQLDLTLAPGEIVALVGESGAGKSTFARLAVGLLTPQSGQVLLDGQDLRDLDPQAVRRLVLLVTQETFLFRGSVADNLRLAAPDAQAVDLVRAAMLADAHEFIERLPNGYETPLEEGGRNLSGGQRQRLALARALLADPKVLVLDEATSALDAASEERICGRLRDIACSRTLVLIAHGSRLREAADRVIVLGGGRPALPTSGLLAPA